MKDERKTKKQLIEELAAERQRSAGVDVSAVERQLAVARVRAEAMDMRGTQDLRRVVAVVFQGMLDLGIETPAATIHVIDESADEVRGYFAHPNPRLSGLDWSPDRAAVDLVVVGDVIAGYQQGPGGDSGLFGSVDAWRERVGDTAVWGSGEPRTHERVNDPNVYLRSQRAIGVPENKALDWFPAGRWFVTNIPFRYGMIGYSERAHHPEHDEIVAELAHGLELGFLRFLDFQRLEDQNIQIADANRLKSDFLNRMSHDLRTPMNAIKGYVAVLLRKTRDALEERQYGNLEKIKQSSDNMLSLIDYIQELSQIAVQEPEIEVEDVDVRGLINDCLDSIASSVKMGVELETDLESVDALRTDPGRVRRVLMDILDNAVRFTDSGKITISLHTVSDRVEISVADTGAGIPEDELPYIFDEFFQVARQKGMPQDGSGLSMARARKSMNLLGGMIYAESEVGRGATFRVRLSDFESPL